MAILNSIIIGVKTNLERLGNLFLAKGSYIIKRFKGYFIPLQLKRNLLKTNERTIKRSDVMFAINKQLVALTKTSRLGPHFELFKMRLNINAISCDYFQIQKQFKYSGQA